MRVVETNRKPGSQKRNTKKRVLLVLLPIVILLGAAGAWQLTRSDAQVQSSEPTSEVATEKTQDEVLSDETTGMREFTQEEFRMLYDNLLQQNLDAVDTPPVITGNDIADTRIRQLAEGRGYKLRNSPASDISSVQGQSVQKPVVEPWLELQAAAAEAGHTITITSAYRSVAEQRELFLSRLQAEGVSVQDVADGEADDEVITVLITTALPGYSKHHTGYTLDILCAGYAFESFNESPCFDWMSANNYEHAKTYGFIPSYPEESDLQGPDPEAWEYVFVGSELLVR